MRVCGNVVISDGHQDHIAMTLATAGLSYTRELQRLSNRDGKQHDATWNVISLIWDATVKSINTLASRTLPNVQQVWCRRNVTGTTIILI